MTEYKTEDSLIEHQILAHPGTTGKLRRADPLLGRLKRSLGEGSGDLLAGGFSLDMFPIPPSPQSF